MAWVDGSRRAILFALFSPNQTAPSAPVAIPHGPLDAVGTVTSSKTPVVEMEATLLPTYSVNHSRPAAAVMNVGSALAVGMGNSVTSPAGVIRPMRFAVAAASVNQMLPSGPTVMAYGRAPAVGSAYSVIVPAVVIRPILLA